MTKKTSENLSWGHAGTWFRSLGPGIITAALVFGPSKIVITTKLGADYNYALIWVIVLAALFMTVFTNMSARIGLATKDTLLTTINKKWGKWAAAGIGFGIFLVTSSFQAGNSVGVGISMAEPTHTSPVIWILLFNVVTILLLFFRNFYSILEKVMITLVFIMLMAFLVTLALAKPVLSEVASGLIPSVPKGSVALIIALVASLFSIVGAAYQSYLVQERKRLHPEIRQTGRESNIGIYILGLLSLTLLICSASVLHSKGINITSASDMAKALEPAFGKYASYIFLTGLFGASFSSLIGNATLGGTLFGDALGLGGSLNSGKIRALIALVVIIGASVAIIFGKLPIQLIILAQAVTIFIVPFIGIAIYLLANNKGLMGEYRNKNFSKVVGLLGILVMLFLAVSNVYMLFF